MSGVEGRVGQKAGTTAWLKAHPGNRAKLDSGFMLVMVSSVRLSTPFYKGVALQDFLLFPPQNAGLFRGEGK